MRTHAFVHFDTKEDAERARYELNGVKITAKYSNNKISKPVRLCKYETKQALHNENDKRANLLAKNLSKEVSAHSLWNLFRQYGDIKSCKLVVDYLGNSKGYGYVSYYRADDAIKAVNELNEKDLNGKLLKVTYLEYGRRVEKKKNNIYVKHFPKEKFGDEDLKKLFEKYGEIKSAIILRDNNGNSKGFGFVCFSNPEDADEAFKAMNGATMFKDQDLPALYVNFAMKKGERLEHLQKKREETFKLAQKMTIFVKIKDESSVKDERDFENQIKNYLKIILGKEYQTKNIKIRFETKNAFITMNSQRDAEEFIRKFQEYSKENPTNLFFNLYKSKVERISANAYFKKFNQFDEDGGNMNTMNNKFNPKPRYQKFNDFSNMQPNQMSEFPYSTINQNQNEMNKPRYRTFNNFDETPNTNLVNPYQQPQQFRQPQQFNNFNNFNQNQPTPTTNQQNVNITKSQVPLGVDLNDDDSIGEYIYTYVEKYFPADAAKITGMIMDFDLEYRQRLIQGKPEEFMKIIRSAHDLLQRQKK